MAVECLSAPVVGRIPALLQNPILMTINWTQIAEARGIVPDDPEKFSSVLTALEAAFRPLVSTIPFPAEPAIILSESAVAGETALVMD